MEGLEVNDQHRGRLAVVADGTQVTVHGSGIDVDPLWRHAGMLLLNSLLVQGLDTEACSLSVLCHV